MKNIKIQMVDLISQYSKIKNEIDRNIISSIDSGRFVNGPIVKQFSENLSTYLDVRNVIPCANGTDALQIAFMALDLKPGDEIICPSWTYIATAEAAAILGIKVIFSSHGYLDDWSMSHSVLKKKLFYYLVLRKLFLRSNIFFSNH